MNRNIQEIEYTVLGTALRRPETVGEIVAAVTEADFAYQSTAGLYETIRALHLRGVPIDRVTVLHETGPDFEAVVEEAEKHHTDNIGYYCEMLHECSRLGAIQGLAMELYGADTLSQADPILDKLNRTMVSRQRLEVLTAREAARQFLEAMTSGKRPEYLPWGLKGLDDLLLCELGDFVLLGGYASSGKTLLSLQFAAIWAQKYRVGYFSLESSNRKLTERMICHLGQVPLRAIKTRDLRPDDAVRLTKAAKILNGLQIDFISASGMSVRDIQAKALSERYQIIVVDYLQIATEASRSRYEEVTAVSIGLHKLAQTHGIMVFALAQLSRPEKVKGKYLHPDMSSFRESGQLEQDADIAMLLYPDKLEDYRSDRILKIAKNKEGEKDRLTLRLYGSTQTFEQVKEDVGQQLRDAGRKAKALNHVQQDLFGPVADDEATPFDGVDEGEARA